MRIKVKDRFSNVDDSSNFNKNTFSLGIKVSYLGMASISGERYSLSFSLRWLNLLTTTIYTIARKPTDLAWSIANEMTNVGIISLILPT